MGLKITTAANGRPEVWIHGIIGASFGGISPNDIRDVMADIPDTKAINVRINSPGGSYPDSVTIHSMLTRRAGEVHSIVDGQACSGGSVIMMAGKTVTMHTGSWVMFHEARGTLDDATAADMRTAADRIDAVNDQLVQIYKPRWKGNEKELRDALKAETWLRDSDAVKWGLADSVDGGMALAACANLESFGYRNVPEAVVQANKAALPGLAAAASALDELFEGSK